MCDVQVAFCLVIPEWKRCLHWKGEYDELSANHHLDPRSLHGREWDV